MRYGHPRSALIALNVNVSGICAGEARLHLPKHTLPTPGVGRITSESRYRLWRLGV